MQINLLNYNALRSNVLWHAAVFVNYIFEHRFTLTNPHLVVNMLTRLCHHGVAESPQDPCRLCISSSGRPSRYHRIDLTVADAGNSLLTEDSVEKELTSRTREHEKRATTPKLARPRLGT